MVLLEIQVSFALLKNFKRKRKKKESKRGQNEERDHESQVQAWCWSAPCGIEQRKMVATAVSRGVEAEWKGRVWATPPFYSIHAKREYPINSCRWLQFQDSLRCWPPAKSKEVASGPFPLFDLFYFIVLDSSRSGWDNSQIKGRDTYLLPWLHCLSGHYPGLTLTVTWGLCLTALHHVLFWSS